MTTTIEKVSQIKLGVYSHTRGVEYTLTDFLKKFVDRGSIGVKVFEVQQLFQTAYGDSDHVLKMEITLHDGTWCHGISGKLDCVIPVHISMSGKFDGFYWGCGDAYGKSAPDLDSMYGRSLYFQAEYITSFPEDDDPGTKKAGSVSYRDMTPQDLYEVILSPHQLQLEAIMDRLIRDRFFQKPMIVFP